MTTLALLASLAVTLVGLIVDHRVITGAPAWLKPTKFAVSLSRYCFTIVWLLHFLQHWTRTVRVIATITALGAFGELALIMLQVVRGVSSHFNYTTPFDGAVFLTMGGLMALVWGAGLLTAILLLRTPLPHPPLAWSIRLGLSIALVGMLVAHRDCE